MSLNSIMNTSLSGMNYARTALETTSHNTVNVNTPGYSRQKVDVTTMPGTHMSYGILGSGTLVTGIRRQTDQMLISQYRDQQSILAGYDQMDLTLQNVETIFGSVDNNHMGKALNDFFTSWSDLASPPVNDSTRPAVISTARTLVADIQSTHAQLADLESALNDQMIDQVGTLNNMLDGVAELNRQILASESHQVTANDLRDQRDELLVAISAITKADVMEREDGTVDVAIGGRTMVSRDMASSLSIIKDPASGTLRVTPEGSRDEIALSDGSLAGLVMARDTQVCDARESLDELAADLIQQVNELHRQGRSTGGSGLNFFTGEGAADIGVSTALADDPTLIAISRSGLAGDTDLAREIADLSLAAPDGGKSVVARYDTLVVDLASSVSAVRFQCETQAQVVDSVATRLESVRGVNTDEEAANLMRYQNAYEAAARVVQVVQQMFDTLLNMV